MQSNEDKDRPPTAAVANDKSGRMDRLEFGCWIAAFGIPIATVVAFVVVRVWLEAVSYCEDYDAPERFGSILLYPIAAAILYGAFVVPGWIALAARQSARIAVLVGLICLALVGYGYVGTAPEKIRSYPYADPALCPNGVVDWWPWFLPR